MKTAQETNYPTMHIEKVDAEWRDRALSAEGKNVYLKQQISDLKARLADAMQHAFTISELTEGDQ